MKTISGSKIEMSQIFLEDGRVVPITSVKVLNEEITLKPGDEVSISGTSKGKGFAGVVKRWGFHGGPKTHGQSDRHRAPGSIGAGTDPGRVWKGQKMAGRMGNQKVTLKKVPVIEINEAQKIIKLKGPVPGSRGSRITIHYAKKE